MKTKLLRKIRKDFSFKYNIQGECDSQPLIYVLNDTYKNVFGKFSSVREFMECFSTTLNWRLYYSYQNKIAQRDSKNHYRRISKL